ncbi:MAG: TatD family hydrolase [Phycisphaerae bacterium]|jgi:TatD DNase family protein
MGLIDSHAHLTDAKLMASIDEVLAQSEAAGVEKIITIGMNPGDSRKAVELADRFPNRVYATAGVHPHEAGKVSEGDLEALADLWAHPKVVAIGEIGLDYHYDFADRSVQRAVFARQLETASTKELPLVIHCREAFADVVSMLHEHGLDNRPVVFHCFSGGREEAEGLDAHGWRLSLTGVVTFPKSTELQAVAKTYPADKLMLETDAPYLSPVPKRGKPNEPAYLVHTARFLADLRGESEAELAVNTRRNTIEFFQLDR